MAPRSREDTQVVVTTLGEKHAIPILEATIGEPVPARTIIEERDVPRTTFYRRIDRLLELDLVTESGAVELDGSHHTAYQCRFDEIRIQVVDGRLVTRISRRAPSTDRWIDAWDDMRGEER